ncbi:MAG TPA: FkbM family methyltransferase [Vicinamibacterales bacterium]|nr:FkbM family methyltransferase [Vicinamibacterales bacterium]
MVAPGIGLSYAMGRSDAVPRFFLPHVRPGMCVFDVGANKGQMTLLFAALVGPTGRVVAIEPAPAEFASLTANVTINTLANVRPIQAAAADREGEMTFTYAAGRPSQGKLQDVERTYVIPEADRFPVRTLSLDSLVGEHARPDVIKIDVEGAAASVLRGAARLLAASSPKIYVEMHGPEEQAGVRDELLSRGYVAETLDGVRVPDPTAGWHNPLWCYRPADRTRT